MIKLNKKAMNEEITVWKAKALKEEMEKKIQAAVDEFEKASGFTVKDVNIETIYGGFSGLFSIVKVETNGI